MYTLLDGKSLTTQLYPTLAERSAKLARAPHLVVILAGHHAASETYVRSKQKNAERAGVQCTVLRYEDTVTREELLNKLHELNADDAVDACFVQQPAPSHIDAAAIITAVTPGKDADGFHPLNQGKILMGLPDSIPAATPAGVIRMLDAYHIPLMGAHAVVIGRSNTVGKPLAALLINRGATVTICNQKPKNLPAHTQMADIVISAVGREKLITADHIREGAVVVDVGINRTAEGKLIGDVDFEHVAPKCTAISPVPGGVGLMTVYCLMENVIRCAELQQGV